MHGSQIFQRGIHGMCDGFGNEREMLTKNKSQTAAMGTTHLEARGKSRAKGLSSLNLCMYTCNNIRCDNSRQHECANCKHAFYYYTDCGVWNWGVRHESVCKCNKQNLWCIDISFLVWTLSFACSTSFSIPPSSLLYIVVNILFPSFCSAFIALSSSSLSVQSFARALSLVSLFCIT